VTLDQPEGQREWRKTEQKRMEKAREEGMLQAISNDFFAFHYFYSIFMLVVGQAHNDQSAFGESGTET
jgi:hypothetical protein